MKPSKIEKVMRHRNDGSPPDLNTPEGVNRQMNNVRLFRRLWLRLMAAMVLLVVLVGVRILLPDTASPAVQIWFAALIIAGVLLNVVVASNYKCPNCSSIPSGTAWSVGLGGGATYNVGVHPFPSRCKTCGYYLGRRALRKDTKSPCAGF
jgi:hypothetical protein